MVGKSRNHGFENSSIKDYFDIKKWRQSDFPIIYLYSMYVLDR